MNIVLMSWGTLGDLMPFVVLARELQERGHTVTLGGPSLFGPTARDQGLRLHPMGSPIKWARFDELTDRIRAQANPRKQLQMLLQEGMVADLGPQYRDALALLHGADAVVCHWMQLAGMMAAETAGVPRATLTLNPLAVAGDTEHDHGSEAAGCPGRRNIARELADLIWGSGVHEFRAEVGLAPIESVSQYQYATALSLVAISKHLLQQDPPWSARHHTLGFFSPAPIQGWTPDEALARFCEPDGRPLVVFSFGSMSGPEAQATLALVTACAASLNVRAVLQAGWGSAHDVHRSANVLPTGHVPHAWLFGRASCVVHHGGAGTTAAALRAGVPSVVVWHMLDQAYWGHALATHGLGLKPVAREALDADTLAALIKTTLETPAFGEHCLRASEAMQHEPGAPGAADLLHEMLTRAGAP